VGAGVAAGVATAVVGEGSAGFFSQPKSRSSNPWRSSSAACGTGRAGVSIPATVAFDYPTPEAITQRLVIAGTVPSVVDQLLAFRETTGDFGTLLYACHDWVDPALGRRSMQLMAEQVLPRVNAALKEA